jgi:predicted nucleotidyltransferase
VTLPEALRAGLDRYVRALEARFGLDLVSVVLFGSWARGEGRAESDIDLLVIIRGLSGGRFERDRPVRDLAKEVSEELADRVSPIVSTPGGAEHVKPYYLGMLSGHMMLHDAGGFSAAVLEGLQRRLRELGARRYVDEDGYEYWDLKPDWKPGDVVSL